MLNKTVSFCSQPLVQLYLAHQHGHCARLQTWGEGGEGARGVLWALWLRGIFVVCYYVSVFQGRICSDNYMCCHTETEVTDQTFHLTKSQYTDTGPTSPSTDLITPGAWQGSHWSANFQVTGMTRPRKNLGASGIGTRDLPLSRRTP